MDDPMACANSINITQQKYQEDFIGCKQSYKKNFIQKGGIVQNKNKLTMEMRSISLIVKS